MAILKPDNITNVGGVTVNEYLLTNHNPNGIAMPKDSMFNKIIGVTIHNTDWINTAAGTTPAEQYTRATVNGNMDDVRVHFYVDDVCAWQNLPHILAGWHAADGDGDGNRRTIAIECIMSPNYNDQDKKAEDNAARLAAFILKKYGFGVDHLFTHHDWYSQKYCPAYILPHWDQFKAKVAGYLNASEVTHKQMYRIRKAWDDTKSQIGAFTNLAGAKASCPDGYSVFDESGTKVFPVETKPAESVTDTQESVSDQSNSVSISIKQLTKGCKGKTVRALQALLINAGYNCGSCGADGDFGDATKDAVVRYQKDKGLDVDGIVGQQTWASLLI